MLDQRTNELTMIAYNGSKNFGGIAGGGGLKLAAKVPYRFTVRFPEESPNGVVELRIKF
jgi:hypothetical protein